MRALQIVLLLTAIGLVQCDAASSDAPVHFDFEPRLFLPADHYIKDHSLVYDGDVFHVFHITGTDSVGRWIEPGNEVDFGHATSRDLRHWQVEWRVIDWAPAAWESRNRWAPHVVRLDDHYRMYYTGVNTKIAQSIGVARSTDLYRWQPLAVEPFHPDTSWARWVETGWSDCRDPFVFEREGSWWMLYTATTLERRGAIGLARAHDGLDWQDQGPLLVGAVNEPLESAQLVELDGRWFLLFTSGREGGTWTIESSSFRGPWDFAARRRWLETIAPEITRARGEIWVSTHGAFPRPDRNAYVLLVDKLRLTDQGLEIDASPRAGPGWQAAEGEAFANQPILDDNPWLRGEPRVGPTGVGWIGTAEGFSRPPDVAGSRRGDQATGTLRSAPFVLDTPAMSLRIGGTTNPQSIYVALRRSSDGEVLYRETGDGDEALELRTWNVSRWRGTEVYLELADLDSAGHLNVDEIRALPAALAPGLAEARPNPFVDTTRLTLPAAPDIRPRPAVKIYDVTGRLIAAVGLERRGDTFEALWDGRDHTGTAVAAGVYFARFETENGDLVARVVRAR